MTNEHKMSRLTERGKKWEICTPWKEDEEKGNRSKGLYKGMLPCACMPMSILIGAIASLESCLLGAHFLTVLSPNYPYFNVAYLE